MPQNSCNSLEDDKRLARQTRPRGKAPLTVLIVPDPTQSPITLRVPTWLLPLLLALVVSVFGAMAIFAVNAQMRVDQLQARLDQEGEVRDVSRSREQEMRHAILSQRDESQNLKQEYANLSQQVQSYQSDVNTQVEGFQAEVQDEVTRIQTGMNEINRLMDEIRGIVGLQATPTPAPSGEAVPAEPSPESMRQTDSAGMADSLGGAEGNIPVRFNLTTIDLQHNSTLDQLREVEAELPAKLAELQQLKEEAAARVAQIDPARRSSPAEIEQQLRLLAVAPKGWPAYGDVTSEFGYRSWFRSSEFHTGLDIGIWYRTPVHVTEDGVVSYAGWEAGYGWTVEVRHSTGFSTLYGHLSRTLVNAGDQVAAGDTIALSGSSGRSTGPHLHYEIRLNGIPIDPAKYVNMKW